MVNRDNLIPILKATQIIPNAGRGFCYYLTLFCHSGYRRWSGLDDKWRAIVATWEQDPCMQVTCAIAVAQQLYDWISANMMKFEGASFSQPVSAILKTLKGVTSNLAMQLPYEFWGNADLDEYVSFVTNVNVVTITRDANHVSSPHALIRIVRPWSKKRVKRADPRHIQTWNPKTLEELTTILTTELKVSTKKDIVVWATPNHYELIQ
jgi:hypothetical protein